MNLMVCIDSPLGLPSSEEHFKFIVNELNINDSSNIELVSKSQTVSLWKLKNINDCDLEKSNQKINDKFESLHVNGFVKFFYMGEWLLE